MSNVFELVIEEFVQDVDAIRAVLTVFAGAHHPARTRIAAANSLTLLAASTFEEFVREMAREYAKLVVAEAQSVEELPRKMIETAWKRTMNKLSSIKFEASIESDVVVSVKSRFDDTLEFCRGDLSRDIYRDLIHNENNMRPGQINELFKISGLSDVCSSACAVAELLDFFGESEQGKAHGKLLEALNAFFNRRNDIAHALNLGSSSSPEQVGADLQLLQTFGVALQKCLESRTPMSDASAAPAHALAPPPATAQPS